MKNWLKSNRWPLALCAAYLILAVAYGLANPPFEATDEIRHFRYIRYIALNQSLPPVSVEASKELQAHHPPLYYILGAILTAPIPSQVTPDYTPPVNPFWGFRYYEPSNDNKNQYLHGPKDQWPLSSGNTLAVFVARWLSTLFGLGVVAMAYRLGKLLFPNKQSIALGAMAFVAFNPTLLHSASSINNDAAAAFFGAWVIVEAVTVAQNKANRWTAALFGLALGLGLMSKVSVGILGGLALVAWLVPLRTNWKSVVRDAAIIAGILLVLTGWWFIRNYLASGDVMGLSDYQSAWQGSSDQAGLIRDAIAGLPYAWTTIWARLDYGQIVLPDWTYYGWDAFTALAVVGLIRVGRRLWGAGLWVTVAAIVLSLAGWAVLMLTIPATAHARHILYAFPAIGILFVVGWAELWPRFLLWIAGLWNLGFALLVLFGYLIPAFAYPSAVTALPSSAYPASANFEGAAEIVGYRVSPAVVKPGSEVDITVYWKPLAQTATQMQVFIHLVDSQGIIAAQRDTFPGLGKAATTTWRVGQVFADTYRVFLPDTVYSPETATVKVGLWNIAESRTLTVDDSDSVVVGTVALQSNPGDLPNPVDVNFNDTMHLTGYSIDNRVLKPGGSFTLQTYWHIDHKLDFRYSIYAHVVGNDGRIWALADSSILPFTTDWEPTKTNGESRTLTLAADTPPGQYTLEFGVIHNDKTSHDRLPVLAPDGHGLGDHIDLARIFVVPP